MDKEIRALGTAASQVPSKQWVKPTLRRLPIAVTASGGQLNEGVGKGKGNSGPNPVS